MGRVRDWSILFMISEAMDSFDALLTDFPHEDMLEAFYVRRERENEAEERLRDVWENAEKMKRQETETFERYVPSYNERVILPIRKRLFWMEEEETFFESLNNSRLNVDPLMGVEAVEAFYENKIAMPKTWEEDVLRLGTAEAVEVKSFREEERGKAFWGEAVAAFGEEGFVEDGMTLTKSERERVIESTVKKEETGRRHEIRVEMKSGDPDREVDDADEIIERMTERLCAMMARGADGIYL